MNQKHYCRLPNLTTWQQSPQNRGRSLRNINFVKIFHFHTSQKCPKVALHTPLYASAPESHWQHLQIPKIPATCGHTEPHYITH